MRKRLWAYGICALLLGVQMFLYAKNYINNNTSFTPTSLFSENKFTSKSKIVEPKINLGYDAIVWDVNHQSINIISNDSYDNGVSLEPITLGVGGNAVLEMKGSWPTGVRLDLATGNLIVDANVGIRPTGMYEYTLCVGAVCKTGYVSFQEKQDFISVTKTITSAESSYRNGANVQFSIVINNSSARDSFVDVVEQFLSPSNLVISDKNILQFTSWTITSTSKQNNVDVDTSLSTNYLQVSGGNSLTGAVTVPSKGKVTIVVNAKLKAVQDDSFQIKTTVNTADGSDNYLANNTALSTIAVCRSTVDLAIETWADNPGTYEENNFFNIKVTNVGSAVFSGANNAQVKFEIPYTGIGINDSNYIKEVSAPDFTYTNTYLASTSRRYTFTLNTTKNLAIGESVIIKFKKEGGFARTELGDNQSRVLAFDLTYSGTAVSNTTCLSAFPNGLNNSSTVEVKNSPNPGEISFSNNSSSLMICSGSTVVIKNKVAGTSNMTAIVGGSLVYNFMYSTDNGINWQYILDPTKDDGTILKLTSLTVNTDVQIPDVTKKTLIKRIGKNSTLFGEFASETSIIEVNVSSFEISTVNNVTSFAIPLQYDVNGVVLPTTFTLPAVISKIDGVQTSNFVNIAYYGEDGTKLSESNPPTVTLTKGEHRYTLVGKTLAGAPAVGCEQAITISVVVYDPKDCKTYKKRTFANKVVRWTSGLAGADKPEQAVNNNRADATTLTGGVVLLGLGTTGVDLYWTNPDGSFVDLNNKKVVIKIGEQYSGVKVAGGLSVIGRKVNSGVTESNLTVWNSSNTGFTYGVKGGVLDLLKGDNVFEYSFIPSEYNGTPVSFNGIRIQLGSLVGVADLASVYYAYLEEEEQVPLDAASFCSSIKGDIIVNPPSSLVYPTNQRDVDASWIREEGNPLRNSNIKLNNFAEDALWGNYSEVLNVASSLSSIVFPYYAVDDDYDSYTLFNATAGVLNRQFLQMKLRQNARIGDQLQITLAYPDINVLNLSLLQLGNFKIVYYLNGSKVGEQPLEEFRVLDIGLFNFKNKRRAVLSRPVNFEFDKIELQQFNTVSVNLGDGLHIHDIRVNPLMAFAGQTDPKQVTKICATEPLAIQNPDYCTDYEVSFARVEEFSADPYTINDAGDPLLDYAGRPIKSILKVHDLTDEDYEELGMPRELKILKIQQTVKGPVVYYDMNLTKLFSGTKYDGRLLVKIQTKRQGCAYGDAQYLRIDVVNCLDAVANPIIKSSADY